MKRVKIHEDKYSPEGHIALLRLLYSAKRKKCLTLKY